MADFKKLLAVLDERIKDLDAVHRETVAEWLQYPSRNQQFFYVADTSGFVRIQHDADFVVTRLYIPSALYVFNGAIVAPQIISLTDRSASRIYTDGGQADGVQAGSAATSAVLRKQDANFVNSQVFLPVGGGGVGGSNNIDNFDYWYKFPVELLLARGGLFHIRNLPVAAAPTAFESQKRRFVLAGYKVYG